MLEHDEERYSARREKVYSFMKIPREVEKFMAYGFFQASWKQDVHYLEFIVVDQKFISYGGSLSGFHVSFPVC
jgi:hypothetical protein